MEVKKCNKFVCHFYDKEKYLVHVITLKQVLNTGLIF